MASYDSRKFATEFSERTQANMEYIWRSVNAEKLSEDNIEGFLKQLEEVIKEIDTLKNQLRTEANDVPNARRKGKDELKSKLHSLAGKLDSSKKSLEGKFNRLVVPGEIKGDELFEVTQLLNSLMGIAVLPYEMYSEIFRGNSSTQLELREKIKQSPEFYSLREFIKALYKADKWNSSYSSDINLGDGIIVFSFLRHIRNAVCHSGDNAALSLLPLDDGKVITEVLFYDKSIKNPDEEFALRLSINDVREMIELIANFYRMPQLEHIDKTETIRNAERRVEKILKKNHLSVGSR